MTGSADNSLIGISLLYFAIVNLLVCVFKGSTKHFVSMATWSFTGGITVVVKARDRFEALLKAEIK
jgi:hypothetical protein